MKNLSLMLGTFFLLSFISIRSSLAEEYNVLDFGAKGDEEQLEIAFIQKTIDKATVNGGVVVFPADKEI